MLREEDFKSAFGKRVWAESYGQFYPKELQEESDQDTPNSSAVSSDTGAAQHEYATPTTGTPLEETVGAFGETKADDVGVPPTPVKVRPTAIPDIFSEPTQPESQPVAAVPQTLEKKVDGPAPSLPVSEPYEQGDNIFRELLTYFLSNKVCRKDVTPVLEEDGNCLLSTVAAVYGLSILTQGRSRSGKSLMIDKLSDILTSVYPLKSCSNKALFGNVEKINENDFLYVIEYQAALDGNPAVKEALKLLTENKDATNDSNGDTQRLGGHLTVLTTGADENKKIQKMDVEVAGRFITLRMSSSPEKTRKISEYQDGLDMGTIQDVEFSEKRYLRLKQHIMNCIDSRNTKFEDPFAKAFYGHHLPQTQKSVHYRTLYKSLVKACANFDRPNRLSTDEKAFVNISDTYLVHELYHQTYCDNLRELTEQSYQALSRSVADPTQIQQLEAEYKAEVEEIEAKKKKQMTKEDWQQIWDSAYKHMEDNHPDLLNKWVKLNSRDNKVVVYDPVQKRDVYLCDVHPPLTVPTTPASVQGDATQLPAAGGGDDTL